jgi:hypothetical protein
MRIQWTSTVGITKPKIVMLQGTSLPALGHGQASVKTDRDMTCDKWHILVDLAVTKKCGTAGEDAHYEGEQMGIYMKSSFVTVKMQHALKHMCLL